MYGGGGVVVLVVACFAVSSVDGGRQDDKKSVNLMDHQVIRTNWGVVFSKVGTILNGVSKYRHTFAVAIPQALYTPLREIDCDSDALKLAHCQAINSLVRSVNRGYREEFVVADANIRRVLSAVPTTGGDDGGGGADDGGNIGRRTRKKRSPHLSANYCKDGATEDRNQGGGILSAFGKVASDLFGTPSFDDIKIVDRHICELADTVSLNAGQIRTTQDHLSSLSSILDDEITSLRSGLGNMNDRITETQEILVNVTRSLEGDLDRLQTRIQLQDDAQEAMYVFFGHLERFQHAVIRRLAYISTWTYGVNKLLEGYVPQELVPTRDVEAVLDHVRRTILQHHPRLQLVHDNPAFYYRVRSTAFTKRNNFLYVMMTVPLKTKGGMLGVYRVDRTPIRTSEDHPSTTRIVNLPDFFAATSDLQYYTELSTAHYLSCRGEDVRVCQTERALQDSDRKTCAAAIFYNSLSAVHEHCDIRYEPNASFPEALRLTHSQYLVHGDQTTSRSWTMHCPYARGTDKIRSVPACGTCIVNVPCGCSLDGDTFLIPLQVTECDFAEDEFGFPTVTKIYPYNLPIMSRLFSDSSFSSRAYSSPEAGTDRPVRLSHYIRNLTGHDDWDEVVARDEKYRMDLTKMIDEGRKKTAAYADKAEYYLKKATDFHDLVQAPLQGLKRIMDGEDLIRILQNPHAVAGGMTTLWICVLVALCLAIYNFCRGRIR